ncbi:MAG TPA: hypothetical protein VJM12_15230 [Pyrinomonadaceae bacterium]|nr:hypothetical protein [Pyrinomonadaceae bacterium]
MPHFLSLSLIVISLTFPAFLTKPSKAPAVTAIAVYGAWHCGNDFCTWASVRNMTDFDTKNRWLIDRGNGQPSVNLVVLSFVHPLRLLNKTTDATTSQGIPIGMNQAVVDYFKTRGVRVSLSIGGITYVDAWNQALATNATQLGLNAAEAAQRLGVGIEIDYEENMNPNLPGLQAFINAYRSVLPYDASGSNHAARLTIDLAAGDRWLIPLTRKATADWLNTTTPVLDYANAMVPSKQPNTAANAQANWQEHVDGKPQFDPPILPLAPAKFTGGLYIVTGTRAAPECTSFSTSLISSTGNYVQTVVPNGAGTTAGMLGYMFWASECPSSRRVCTTPPNTCEGGVGVGAQTYNIPIPMPSLRQS